MRHALRGRKLGRTSAHREALFRNQIQSLVENERIVTTLPKAKELRLIAEKVITHGKHGTVHDRRWVLRGAAPRCSSPRFSTMIAPRFSERPGGYLRIVKLGPRQGDGAEMAALELVERGDAAAAAPADTDKGKKAALHESRSQEGGPEEGRQGGRRQGPQEGAARRRRPPPARRSSFSRDFRRPVRSRTGRFVCYESPHGTRGSTFLQILARAQRPEPARGELPHRRGDRDDLPAAADLPLHGPGGRGHDPGRHRRGGGVHGGAAQARERLVVGPCGPAQAPDRPGVRSRLGDPPRSASRSRPARSSRSA